MDSEPQSNVKTQGQTNKPPSTSSTPITDLIWTAFRRGTLRTSAEWRNVWRGLWLATRPTSPNHRDSDYISARKSCVWILATIR
jgi:hypothetical protein